MLILSVILRPSKGAYYNLGLLGRQYNFDKIHTVTGLQGNVIHFSRRMSYVFY
jgi:hypothetical protein